jgi:hypothetical protein
VCGGGGGGAGGVTCGRLLFCSSAAVGGFLIGACEGERAGAIYEFLNAFGRGAASGRVLFGGFTVQVLTLVTLARRHSEYTGCVRIYLLLHASP